MENTFRGRRGRTSCRASLRPEPLSALADEMPGAFSDLLAAAQTLERAGRDVQDIEFTIERGQLFFLQSRSAKLSPHAAARIAVDLVREGLVDEDAALRRITPDQVRILLAPHISPSALHGAYALASGEGASPGVGIGVLVRDSDEAERRAQAGEAVILARLTTSPDDLHGMIASRAVVTELGGSTSHAAVVGRALGLPLRCRLRKGRARGSRWTHRHGRRPDRQSLRRRADNRIVRRERP